ncbi:MAG TPA: CDP-alcohol phosphatidyltransferase family protein [Terriglobales bacterium]|nr:CDP-alcohol phosphatidyltransferase family protein [Terriglobales bacterium]
MATLVQAQSFRPANRVMESILAPAERRALRWFAAHMPARINSDHLTVLGLLSMIAAGLAYWAASHEPLALIAVCVFLSLNWFGDSLDGTLARFRDQQRPRYGFYVDHVIDAIGSLFLLGGLTLSGYMHPAIAIGLLLAYNLLAMESYLATYTIGEFRLTHFLFGPTELRVLLVIGNLYLLYKPMVHILGRTMHLFDVGGICGIAGMLLVFIITTVRNTTKLYREETRR